MKNLTQLGVASALIGASLLFSACGGDSTSKAEAFVKEKYPDAQILTFDEAKKEFGLKDKECLNQTKKDAAFHKFYVFAQLDGEVKILEVETRLDKDIWRINDTYSVEHFKNFKIHNENCFN